MNGMWDFPFFPGKEKTKQKKNRGVGSTTQTEKERREKKGGQVIRI
ncbi:MAG: hypothetical protein Devi2KO_39480 [Devosia indica]